MTGKGLGQLHMWTLQSIILNDFMQPTDKSRPVSHLFLWCILACFCCPLCTYKPCILYFKTVSISNIPSCWLPSTNCPYRKPSRTVLTVLIQWVLQTISYWNVKKENRRERQSLPLSSHPPPSSYLHFQNCLNDCVLFLKFCHFNTQHILTC